MEVMRREKRETESDQGRRIAMVMVKRLGVLTKKTLVAQRMKQTMMVGPLSAAEQQLLHPFGFLKASYCCQ